MKAFWTITTLFLPLFLLCSGESRGQTAVPLTAGSFNHDAVGENGCTGSNPLTIATSMDASGYAFNGASGWPGSLSYNYGSNNYSLRPYTGANARQVLGNSSATLTLQSAARLANLNFLVTSTEGTSNATFTVNFTDATSQTLMSVGTPDWITGGGGQFISNATSTNDCDVKGGGKLYQVGGNISPANYGKFVQSITVSRGNETSRLYIFGASSCGSGPYFSACPGNLSVSCPGPVSYNATANDFTSLTYSFSGATGGSGSGTGSGSSFNPGVTNVTITASNSCGTQTCSFSVTVQDNTAPVILATPSLPKSIVTLGRQSTYSNVQLNGGTNSLTVAPGASVTLTGNYSYSYAGGAGCPFCYTQHYIGLQGINLHCHDFGNQGQQSGSGSINSTFNAPAVPGVYYITQGGSWCFNCGDCIPAFNNNFADAIAVLVVTANNYTNTPGQCGTVVNYNAIPAYDECGVTLTQTAGIASGQFFPVGTTTNTFVATDPSGNSTSYSFNVTVVDNQAPNAQCQNVTVTLNNAGNGSTTAAAVNNGSTDNCGIQSLSLSQTAFSCANAGPNTVTLTVTDIYNNQGTCNATVTVVDNISPTISCPSPITVNVDPGTCNARVCYTSPVASDNCAPATPAGYNYYNQFGNSYYYRSNTATNYGTARTNARAAGGHLATITSSAENAAVNLNPPPGSLWIGGTDELQEGNWAWETCEPFSYSNWDFLEPNNLGGNESYIEIVNSGEWNDLNGSNLRFSILEIEGARFVQTAGLGQNALFPVGTTTNTFVVTDASGNTNQCSFTVTVVDNVAPVALCKNITVNLSGPSVSITAAQINNGSYDNCGSVSLSVIPTTFNCNQVGQNLVQLTVTDASNNSSTCFSQVTVVDNTVPTAACKNISVALAGSSVTIAPAQIDNGSSDNCSFTLSASPASFTCANVGPNNVTLTVTDMSNNSSSCTAVVTVVDNTLPVALCKNITVPLVGNAASITPAQVDNGSSDNCSFTLSASPTSFTCANVGPNTVTLTATDPSNNFSSCNAIVTIIDNTPPTALCQNVTVQLDNTGNGSTSATAVDNGSNDACGIQSLSLSQTAFDCSHVGGNTVTLTVTDVNNNTSTCTATVTVEDNVAPVAICQNVTVQLDNTGNGSTSAALVDNGSNDACGIQSLSLSQTAFDCSHVGGNTVTLTVTDVNNNTSTCTATVTVEDNVAPVAICQNVTVQLDNTGNGSTSAALVDNGSNDACGIQSLSLSQTAFDCSHVGGNTVTLTVTDVNNNTSTCTATVTVEDNVAPVAICQNVTVQLDNTGNGSTSATAVDNGSNDACGIQSLSLSQTTFDCSHVGGNTVTLTVTDVNNNTSTCTATVTVEDNVAPVAICQNVTVQLDNTGNGSTSAALVDNGSNDACGIQSLSLSQTAFDCSHVGGNTVTLTVTDVNNNTSTCTATVTVEDNVAPVAICQNVTVQLDANGNGSTTAAAVNNGSNDACGIQSLSLSQTAFDCSHVGGNTVTLTVTDVNNNTSTCTATVTVEDNVAPVAICQNVTVQLDANGNGSTTAAAVNNGSNDACGIQSLSLSQTAFDCSHVGGNTVTLTVTDVNNNTSTCTATVTVEDNMAPVAICQNVTVQLDANGNGSTTAAAVNDSSSDACGIQSLSLSQTAFDCSHVGPNPVTLTVTDNNGNQSTCNATVTVQLNANTVIAYALLAQEEVHIHKTTVNGNVGVWQAGKDAKIHDYSTVSGYVRAPNIDVDNNSSAGGQVLAQAPQPTPASFKYNTQTDPNSDVNVPDNYVGVYPLTGNLFRKIEVGKNSTVQFMSSGEIFIKEFKTKDSDNGKQSTVLFSGNTELIIRKKLELGKRTLFNWGGTSSVKAYVEEDDVKVKELCKVNASIDVRFKDLNTDDGEESNHTLMWGQFIAKKIDSKKWVDWNWSSSGCPSSAPPMMLAGVTQFNAVGQVSAGIPRVDISWVTNEDLNNDYYSVEKTLDGTHFEPVLNENSRYGDDKFRAYQKVDPTAAEGDWLYRLKVTRNDGTTVYSELKRVILELPGDYTLFPNPANQQVNVALRGYEGKAALLQIVNSQGVVIEQREVESIPAEPLSFDLHDYRDGMYYLNVQVEGKRSRALKFVVAKAAGVPVSKY